ncbi:MAG TPA: DUF3465 domain-containing protein [Methylotenera sp.]|nr:DUF3465 domain-containing protein [Methylotenera sp.]
MLRRVLNTSVLLSLALLAAACNKPAEPVSIQPSSQFVSANESNAATSDNASIEHAYEHKQSDVQVSGHGTVVKLLADDTQGSRHQKFLVKINPQQTLLFAHNIDLAAKIPLQVGDEITFSGEYVYNPKGGIMHWTHLDPHGHHPSGWIMLHGNKYQ